MHEHYRAIDERIVRKLTMAHHRLLAHVHDEDQRADLARRVVEEQLTADQLDRVIQGDKPPSDRLQALFAHLSTFPGRADTPALVQSIQASMALHEHNWSERKEYIEYCDPVFGDGMKPRLDIKCTMWLALVNGADSEDTDSAELPADCSISLPIITVDAEQKPIKDEEVVDFLGPDTDFGFRVARNGWPSAVNVSPRLAYLIFRELNGLIEESHHAMIDRFRVVGVSEMKGVQFSPRAPVVWYSDHFRSSGLRKDFQDRVRSELNIHPGELELDSFRGSKTFDYLTWYVNSLPEAAQPNSRFAPVLHRLRSGRSSRGEKKRQAKSSNSVKKERQNP